MSDQFKGVSPYERMEHSDENHAKKVNNYIWDGANWVREEASSGGGLATVTILSMPTTSVTGQVSVTGLPTVSVAALPSLTGQLSKFRASTSVTTCISGATTSLTLKASNTGRIRATIYNNSTQNLYVKEGATASATSYTYLLGSGDLVIIDDYVGQVDGVWNGVNGSAQVGEVT